MKYRYLFNSIRFKMVVVFLVFMLPLIACLIIGSGYAIKVVRNQVAQSNMHMVDLYMQQIDRNLEEVDKYLYNMAAINTDLLDMELPEKDKSNDYYKAKIRLSNLLLSDINNYKTIDLFFIYSAVNGDLLTTQSSGNTYSERDAINNEIVRILKNDKLLKQYNFDQWLIYRIGERYYLYHIVKVGGVFIGAWVNAEKMMVPIKLINLGQNGVAVLATDDFQPMDKKEFINSNKISLAYARDIYSLSGDNDKYLIVGEKSSKGEFNFVAVIPDSTILEKLPYIQKILYLFPAISILIILAYMAFLSKSILIPIQRIVKIMRKIKNGDLSIQITPFRTSNEFELMNLNFNSMLSQIKQLKIHIYEEEINKQKEELKNLQLQINPHFFLNSLNVIYQLAQVNNFALIQEMSLCLVEYFRFIFRNNNSFSLMEDEIKHARNYLRIQELRFPGYLTFDISIPESFLNCLIPSLLVQTFVENTIKHAITLDDPVNICIEVTSCDFLACPAIRILIKDTGKGFPENILLTLQQDKNIVNDMGEHIGICNAKQRLRLLYKDEARITFSNSPKGGACVEIILPVQVKE